MMDIDVVLAGEEEMMLEEALEEFERNKTVKLEDLESWRVSAF